MTSETGIQARLERLLDRTEIFDLVRYERLCRDQRDFPAMIACYVATAPVRTTWFDGTIEDFAEASRKKMTSGSQAKHWIMPARLEIKDDRALSTWLSRAQRAISAPTLDLQFWIHSRDSRVGLNGSGLLLFNPPYQFDERAAVWQAELLQLLSKTPHGGHAVRWLTAEAGRDHASA